MSKVLKIQKTVLDIIEGIKQPSYPLTDNVVKELLRVNKSCNSSMSALDDLVKYQRWPESYLHSVATPVDKLYTYLVFLSVRSEQILTENKLAIVKEKT